MSRRLVSEQNPHVDENATVETADSDKDGKEDIPRKLCLTKCCIRSRFAIVIFPPGCLVILLELTRGLWYLLSYDTSVTVCWVPFEQLACDMGVGWGAIDDIDTPWNLHNTNHS